MSKLEFQEVEISEIVAELIAKLEASDLFSATGRSFANIEAPNGRVYTMGIHLTSSNDDLLRDLELPYVSPAKVKQGLGIVRAPLGQFKNGEKVDPNTLEFPDIDAY